MRHLDIRPTGRPYRPRSPGSAGPLAASIGRRIRERRRGLRWSQARLREATGLSGSFISDVENGVRSMSVDTLATFATALGVRPSWFLEG
jgi:transcriptional regulator with XRE-family HTH domain